MIQSGSKYKQKGINMDNIYSNNTPFLASGTITALGKWNVDIFSKAGIVEYAKANDLNNKAIISFYTSSSKRDSKGTKVNYNGLCENVFYIDIPDIDIDILDDYGYTYETYLAQADELAKFIYRAKEEGRDIICQCDFGQSRSAACAAAILQHFEGRGIDVFSDYRYYPNQLVYNKIYDALERIKYAR
jgi:hypothetical protein